MESFLQFFIENPDNRELVTISGRYQILPNQIRVIADNDVIKYYRWLFNKAHYNTVKTNTPAHGAHVNITLPKIHGNLDTTPFKHLDGKKVSFQVDVSGNYGGFQKNFRNFWLDAYCDDFSAIRKYYGIEPKSDGFAEFHLTILNTKNLPK